MSGPHGRRYACPVCADTFQSAWHRDEHFDAFHIVIDATLLPHDTPIASACPTTAPACREEEKLRISERETPMIPEPKSRAVGPTSKPTSIYRYIYYDSRREHCAWFVQMCLRGRTFMSPHFATEAEALQAFAEEMEKRGTPMSLPPLKAAPKAADPGRLARTAEPGP